MATATHQSWRFAAFFMLFFASSLCLRATAATLPCESDLKAQKAITQDKLVIGLAPFKLTGNLTYMQFRAKVESVVREAQKKKVQLLVLPELIASDLVDPSEKEKSLKVQFEEVARKHTPQYMADLVQMAAGSGIAILGGTFPRWHGKKVRNTAFLAFPNHHLVGQDKLKLTPEERDWGWEQGTILSTIDAPWGRTIILTCYDAEFPQHSAKMSDAFPDLILVPSMTEDQNGFRRVRWTAQARAIEQRAYVAHVGTVGRLDPHWDNYGQASVLGPSEKGFKGLMGEGKANSDQLLVVTLDMKKLRQAKRKVGSYPACDARSSDVAVKPIKTSGPKATK